MTKGNKVKKNVKQKSSRATVTTKDSGRTVYVHTSLIYLRFSGQFDKWRLCHTLEFVSSFVGFGSFAWTFFFSIPDAVWRWCCCCCLWMPLVQLEIIDEAHNVLRAYDLLYVQYIVQSIHTIDILLWNECILLFYSMRISAYLSQYRFSCMKRSLNKSLY